MVINFGKLCLQAINFSGYCHTVVKYLNQVFKSKQNFLPNMTKNTIYIKEMISDDLTLVMYNDLPESKCAETVYFYFVIFVVVHCI